MAHDPGDDYAVGYGRPPLHSRFRKGRSGNPNGRPKGSPNLDTVLTRALTEQVVVSERGRRRRVSKLVVLVTQLVNKAAGGDLRAVQQVLALQQAISAPRGNDGDVCPPTDEADRQIIARLQQRIARMHEPEDGDDGSEPA